jgi:hypothetical protein
LVLHLEQLSATELKTLSKAVDAERKRRGRKSPTNHEPPEWPIPKKAVKGKGNGAGKLGDEPIFTG